jgi:hypothetical protein
VSPVSRLERVTHTFSPGPTLLTVRSTQPVPYIPQTEFYISCVNTAIGTQYLEDWQRGKSTSLRFAPRMNGIAMTVSLMLYKHLP